MTYFNESNDDLFRFDAPSTYQDLSLLMKSKTRMSEEDEAWFTRAHPLHFHSREIRALKKRKAGLKRRSVDDSCGPSLSKSFKFWEDDIENERRRNVAKARTTGKDANKHGIVGAQHSQPLAPNVKFLTVAENKEPVDTLSLMTKYWVKPSASLTRNTKSRERRINDTKPLVKTKKPNTSSSGSKTNKADVHRLQQKTSISLKASSNKKTSMSTTMLTYSANSRGSKRKQELHPRTNGRDKSKVKIKIHGHNLRDAPQDEISKIKSRAGFRHPKSHSVIDVKRWEKQTGQQYFLLSPEGRREANVAIQNMLR